jgi:hypothetical protein
MPFRKLGLAVAVLVLLAPAAGAQDSLRQVWVQDSLRQAMVEAARQAQVRAIFERIRRERSPSTEAIARQMATRLRLEQRALDSLLVRSRDQYWQEVAQLWVQEQMLRQVRDSTRRMLLTQMFSAEALARGLKRAYREALDSAQALAIRTRLKAVLDRHFAVEDSLRALEIAEVERRLARVRAEAEARQRTRAELVRRMVEQILRDSKQP